MRMFQKGFLIPLVCTLAFMVQGLTGTVASEAYNLTQGPIQYDRDGDIAAEMYYTEIPILPDCTERPYRRE